MHIYATLKCFLYTNAMIKHNVFHVDLNNKKSLELQWKFKKKIWMKYLSMASSLQFYFVLLICIINNFVLFAYLF